MSVNASMRRVATGRRAVALAAVMVTAITGCYSDPEAEPARRGDDECCGGHDDHVARDVVHVQRSRADAGPR
jgi:hypothetical protein